MKHADQGNCTHLRLVLMEKNDCTLQKELIGKTGNENVMATSIVNNDHHIRNDSSLVLPNIVAGNLGSTLAILLLHPLDTIVVRIQASPPNNKPRLANLVDMMWRKEGIGSFYRGITSSIGGSLLVNTVFFGVYGGLLDRLQFIFPRMDVVNTNLAKKNHAPSLTNVALAGIGSGLVYSLLCCPTELATIQCQAPESHWKKGPWRYLFYAAKEYGVRRAWCRGMGMTMAREGPSSGVYFLTFEGLLRLWGRDSYDCPTSELAAAGALAGVTGLLSAYPFDLLKTRIQSLPPSQDIPSALSIAKKSFKVGGWKSLWRGIGVQMMETVPNNIVFFVTYAWFMHHLTKRNDS